MTREPIHIREARPGDRAAVRRMWRALALHQAAVEPRFELADDYMKRWEADFDPWLQSLVDGLYVAEAEGDSACGFVHVRAHEAAPIFSGPPEALVEAVWTDPGHRRRGIATALIGAAVEWARAFGAERIRFAVAVADADAVTFWERMGGVPLLAYGTIAVAG
jgi:GNAT superfamily N-acetyltransferase